MSTTTAAAPVRPGAPEPQGSRSHTTDPRRRKRTLMAVGGALVALVFVAPYIVMVLDSLRTSSDVKSTPPSFLPKVWQLDTYAQILGDERFLNWLKTSLIVATGSTVIVILVAIPAAFMTARHRFPGRGAFLLLVLVTQMFAPTSLVVGPLPAVLRAQHDQHLRGADLHERRVQPRLRDLDPARLLLLDPPRGRGGRRPGRREPLADPAPGHAALTLPGLVTATIFTFIAAWNEYVVALTLMIDDDKKPLTVGMRAYITGYEQHWDQLFAASVIAVVRS